MINYVSLFSACKEEGINLRFSRDSLFMIPKRKKSISIVPKNS